MRLLARRFGLFAYRAEANGLDSFPKSSKRPDWVLICEGSKFVRYEVLPDVVSDHLAVISEVRIGRVPPRGAREPQFLSRRIGSAGADGGPGIPQAL